MKRGDGLSPVGRQRRVVTIRGRTPFVTARPLSLGRPEGGRRFTKAPARRRLMGAVVGLVVAAFFLLGLSACTLNSQSCSPTTVTACALTNFPAVTLTGATQHVHTSIGGVHVRGTATDAHGWTLSTFMVPTRDNPNPACRTVAAFCDSTAATVSSDNARIPPGTLLLDKPKCTPTNGNANPPPTAKVGGTYSYTTLIVCQATKTHSSGTFVMTATLTLTIPASSFAGSYYATVLFLVA
jgi:hypothetical protein